MAKSVSQTKSISQDMQDVKSQENSQKNSQLLRDKMKQADFRLVDLAEFLGISRPTAYKFIEFYELGQRDKLESKVLRLFEFIDKNEPSKVQITSYIATHLIAPQTSARNELIKDLLKKESKAKIAFIELLAKSELYDGILEYLLVCAKLATKAKLSQAERDKLAPLLAFYSALKLKFITKDTQ